MIQSKEIVSNQRGSVYVDFFFIFEHFIHLLTVSVLFCLKDFFSTETTKLEAGNLSLVDEPSF